MPVPNLKIQALLVSEFDTFARYLNEHLKDNGEPPAGYFQPLSRDLSVFVGERAERFRRALVVPVGHTGWRRAWIARDEADAIVGHVDLRAHAEAFTTHRCLLGLGVAGSHRRQGLAQRLVVTACRWARSEANIDYVDLQVLSNNTAALALYRAMGFRQVGEVVDMFRIDGRSLDYTSMTLALGPGT
ncbi:MAG TPA: GNAT family N-acetyltransferase [Ideonella sp.]|uniref:GNAT family N-acetyltransferase n=1 Tax=Ideonella sp. TaxID=1929293 RepID=UPI002E36808D|nr:GNAT family N-acetyltransferase [Ideonella sp.]HEX5688311.1 GNAT family N-acetyltransferase [Ideonella sp.]